MTFIALQRVSLAELWFILPIQILSITSSSMKVNNSWLKMSISLLTVQSHGHFHRLGRHFSSLKRPHFTSGRHDASTRLLPTERLAFTKQLRAWYYSILQANPPSAVINICCLALSYCLGIPWLNEIWRGHAYVNSAFFFFLFFFSFFSSLQSFLKQHYAPEGFS